jgi:hypothetical protein
MPQNKMPQNKMPQNNKETPNDMKRRTIFLMLILPLLSLFSTLDIYAQPSDGELRPKAPPPLKPKPNTRPTPRNKNVGLTPEVYNQRYLQIYNDYTGSKASPNETVTRLEDIVKQAPEDRFRASAWQFLGLLYLHGQNDPVKAEEAMEQAIRCKGSALIEISFDQKWRQMTKDFKFEDLGKGWIRIESGRLTLVDRSSGAPLKNDKIDASLTAQQIREVEKTLNSAFPQVKITTDTTKKPYIFAAGEKRQVEADLVIKLIQKHVLGKAPVQGKATVKGKAADQVRR